MLSRLKLNDAIFWQKERIRFHAYRANEKENQSEAEKITQHEKERHRKQKYKFKDKVRSFTCFTKIKIDSKMFS